MRAASSARAASAAAADSSGALGLAGGLRAQLPSDSRVRAASSLSSRLRSAFCSAIWARSSPRAALDLLRLLRLLRERSGLARLRGVQFLDGLALLGDLGVQAAAMSFSRSHSACSAPRPLCAALILSSHSRNRFWLKPPRQSRVRRISR